MACGLFFRNFGILFVLNLLLSFFYSFGNEPVLATTQATDTDYFLPECHPIKPLLDSLFSDSRIILNLKTLKKAGFIFSKPRKFTNLVVARHPELPGFIFKLYLDAQRYHKDRPELHFWMLRAQGADLVREAIEANHLHEWLKVPQKWIYKLPRKPSCPKGYMKKKYILVEEDMYLLSHDENEKLWESSFVTSQHLQAVYFILKKVGLSDCAKPDNMPFSIDGRIAFIDTQTHGCRVPYDNLSSWLSTENQTYWKQLTQK